MKSKRKLERTLQAVFRSGLDITIISRSDRGVDFNFLPFETIAEGAYDLEDWHYVRTYGELADAIDSVVLRAFPDSRYPVELEATRARSRYGRDLCSTLQALYDCAIDVTITRLDATGMDFALVSCLEYLDSKPQDWRHVQDCYALAETLHHTALKEFENNKYAQKQAASATKALAAGAAPQFFGE